MGAKRKPTNSFVSAIDKASLGDAAVVTNLATITYLLHKNLESQLEIYNSNYLKDLKTYVEYKTVDDSGKPMRHVRTIFYICSEKFNTKNKVFQVKQVGGNINIVGVKFTLTQFVENFHSTETSLAKFESGKHVNKYELNNHITNAIIKAGTIR